MIEVISGCLIWVPLAIWGIALVNWMIGGDIDIVTGVAALGIGAGLGITAQRPPIPIMSPIALLMVVATVILYPFAAGVMNRIELKGVDVELVARAYRMVGQNPGNPLAKFKLAESIYRLGMIGHAVTIGEEAVKQLPERVALDEYRTLKKWKARPIPVETLKPIPCVECNTPCLAGWTHCRNCGAQFLLDRAKGNVLPAGSPRKIIAGWVAVASVLIGLPFATSLTPVAGVAMATLVVAVSAGVLFIAFRPVHGSIA